MWRTDAGSQQPLWPDRDQDTGCVSFPFNVAQGAMRDAQVLEPSSQSLAELTDAGAVFKTVDGRYSHMNYFFLFGGLTGISE